MEVAHRKFGNKWGQFDRYCKLVLYHEAINYLRELQRKSDHEKPLDVLSLEEWDKHPQITADKITGPHACIDKCMKHRLQIKLIHTIAAND